MDDQIFGCQGRSLTMEVDRCTAGAGKNNITPGDAEQPEQPEPEPFKSPQAPKKCLVCFQFSWPLHSGRASCGSYAAYATNPAAQLQFVIVASGALWRNIIFHRFRTITGLLSSGCTPTSKQTEHPTPLSCGISIEAVYNCRIRADAHVLRENSSH